MRHVKKKKRKIESHSVSKCFGSLGTVISALSIAVFHSFSLHCKHIAWSCIVHFVVPLSVKDILYWHFLRAFFVPLTLENDTPLRKHFTSADPVFPSSAAKPPSSTSITFILGAPPIWLSVFKRHSPQSSSSISMLESAWNFSPCSHDRTQHGPGGDGSMGVGG